ncbi:hypothetical protein [Candidatus Liberibacter brunswickensis]|uniref:hypothetical protein n=1 Tax=Candidatus Liberibacter brunswickensis TaxID=1968796 RepID=UPI002FE346BC
MIKYLRAIERLIVDSDPQFASHDLGICRATLEKQLSAISQIKLENLSFLCPKDNLKSKIDYLREKTFLL